jgi:hypothetical protein
VFEDRLQILLLAHVPRRDDLAKRRPDRAILEELDERGGRLFLQDADRGVQIGLLRLVAALDQLRKVRQEPRRERRALRVARDRNLAAARGDLDAEGILEEPKVFVVDTEERAESRLGKRERDGVRSDLVRSFERKDRGSRDGASRRVVPISPFSYLACSLTKSTMTSPWTLLTRRSSV